MQTSVSSLVRQAGFDSVEALDRRILELAGHLLRGNSLVLCGAYCVDRLRSDVWHKLLRCEERGLRALAEADCAEAYLMATIQNQLRDVARREASRRRRLEREAATSQPQSHCEHAPFDPAETHQFLKRAAVFVEQYGDELDGIVFRELILKDGVATELATELGGKGLSIRVGLLYVRKTRLRRKIREWLCRESDRHQGAGV